MDSIEGPNLLSVLWERWVPGFPVQASLLGAWLVWIFLLLLGGLVTLRLATRPGRLQAALELIWEYITGMSQQLAGPHGPRFAPFFMTLFMFILCSNMLGMIPGFAAPTASLSTTAALALIVAGAAEYHQVRVRGLGGYLLHFCGPPYWMAPLFIVVRGVEIFTRPLALAMRLFGNMMAKEIMLAVLLYLMTLLFFQQSVAARTLAVVPFLLRPAIFMLGALVGLVQALVFTSLAMMYIGSAYE